MSELKACYFTELAGNEIWRFVASTDGLMVMVVKSKDLSAPLFKIKKSNVNVCYNGAIGLITLSYYNTVILSP